MNNAIGVIKGDNECSWLWSYTCKSKKNKYLIIEDIPLSGYQYNICLFGERVTTLSYWWEVIEFFGELEKGQHASRTNRAITRANKRNRTKSKK